MADPQYELDPNEVRLVERTDGSSGPPPGARRPGLRTDDRSLGDLLGELADETTTLVKQEIALAKTEIREDLRTAGKNAGTIAAGGAVAYTGLITLVFGLALLLGTFMPDWLAFLLLGLVVAFVGYGLAQKGFTTLKEMDKKPERTIKTLKEDKEWLKQETL